MAPSLASAGPALVFEPYNGTVFYAEDPDASWFPASLTKLMTAYVTFEALKAETVKPDTKVICSQKASAQAPSKLGLAVGGEITLDVALKVLIVKSANDVAVMVAETVAGSTEAFVQRMNEQAQRLGMTRTHFDNVNGLPDEQQFTTARDRHAEPAWSPLQGPDDAVDRVAGEAGLWVDALRAGFRSSAGAATASLETFLSGRTFPLARLARSASMRSMT